VFGNVVRASFEPERVWRVIVLTCCVGEEGSSHGRKMAIPRLAAHFFSRWHPFEGSHQTTLETLFAAASAAIFAFVLAVI